MYGGFSKQKLKKDMEGGGYGLLNCSEGSVYMEDSIFTETEEEYGGGGGDMAY